MHFLKSPQSSALTCFLSHPLLPLTSLLSCLLSFPLLIFFSILLCALFFSASLLFTVWPLLLVSVMLFFCPLIALWCPLLSSEWGPDRCVPREPHWLNARAGRAHRQSQVFPSRSFTGPFQSPGEPPPYQVTPARVCVYRINVIL